MKHPNASLLQINHYLQCGYFIGHSLYEQSPAVFFNGNLITTLKAKVLEPFTLQPDERQPFFAIEVCIIDSQNTRILAFTRQTIYPLS